MEEVEFMIFECQLPSGRIFYKLGKDDALGNDGQFFNLHVVRDSVTESISINRAHVFWVSTRKIKEMVPIKLYVPPSAREERTVNPPEPSPESAPLKPARKPRKRYVKPTAKPVETA